MVHVRMNYIQTKILLQHINCYFFLGQMHVPFVDLYVKVLGVLFPALQIQQNSFSLKKKRKKIRFFDSSVLVCALIPQSLIRASSLYVLRFDNLLTYMSN